MKHVLGWASFEILDGFRDDSTYMYQSPDEHDLAQVTPMPDAADANDILKSSTAALEAFYGSALMYTRPKQFGLDGGAEAPGIEGEILDPATGARKCLALIAIHRGRCKANLLVIGGPTAFFASVALVGPHRRRADRRGVHRRSHDSDHCKRNCIDHPMRTRTGRPPFVAGANRNWRAACDADSSSP